MANVIHRTALTFLASVNTPDYPEPTWKHNPSMTGVAGIPFIYWKAPADWDAAGAGPVEMSSGEKATVDAAIAAAAAAAKVANFDAIRPPGVVKPVLKKTDETRTATTAFVDDAVLLFPIEANKDYLFRMRVWFDTTAAGDFKFQIAGPASPVGVRIKRCSVAAGATALGNIGVQTAFGVSVAVTGTGTTGGYVEIEGGVRNGNNAGNVSFQWAQNTSDPGNTIVRAGSYLEYARIA